MIHKSVLPADRPSRPASSPIAADAFRLDALLPIPVDASGVSHTCWSILAGGARAGWPVRLLAPFLRHDGGAGFPVRSLFPGARPPLPYSMIEPLAHKLLRRRFLAAVDAQSVAYLWTRVPVRTFEALARRGVPIVTEAVNTNMAAAREVLDAAYAALGVRPEHGITDERIALQEARNALSSAIVAPSPLVEQSYLATAHAGRIVPSGFGAWVPAELPDRPRMAGRPVRFLFVGRDDVRKGLHLLLEAWRQPPAGAELRIVGEISPLIRRLYADVLDQPSVSAAGFCPDPSAEYLAADVAILPSLEEGDPIVTYEAAAHGLPVIASVVGAGRFGAETGLVDLVTPTETAALRDVLDRYTRDEDLRRHRGAANRAASFAYDWSRVAPARLERLSAFLAR